MAKKRVLIVYYSFTQQTKLLLKQFVAGLEGDAIEVQWERLLPTDPYQFPFKSNMRLAFAMLATFFQKRMALQPISARCSEAWDCVVLAGPTWSYHPSGPMLEFLDRHGPDVCGGRIVVPFISCRSYWRWHNWTIRRKLLPYTKEIQDPIVFMHPIKEPWRIMGLIFQLRGKIIRREHSWFRRHYPGYGHSKEQGREALELGHILAERLLKDC